MTKRCWDVFIKFEGGRETQFSARCDTKAAAESLAAEKNAHPARQGWTAVVREGRRFIPKGATP